MKYSDEPHHLGVEIHAKGCDIPSDERARMQALLGPLGEAVEDFPTSDLWINVIYHPRIQTYHVEFKLKLPGQALFSGETDPYLDSAFQRGLGRLVREVQAYREHPDRRAAEVAEHRLALDQGVAVPEDPDSGPLAEAARAGDYRTFRTDLASYEGGCGGGSGGGSSATPRRRPGSATGCCWATWSRKSTSTPSSASPSGRPTSR
jgi:hypothetical protein